jgi:hypothetical protein
MAIVALIVCPALAASIFVAQAGGASTPQGEEPITRSYAAGVISGTGAYQTANGGVKITLASSRIRTVPLSPFREGGEYAITMTLRGRTCKHFRHHARRGCIALAGTITGRGVGEQVIPDTAPRIKLTALSGRVWPLGAVTGTGAITGTGFILQGKRHLYTTLVAGRGTLTVGGSGPDVPAFSAP